MSKYINSCRIIQRSLNTPLARMCVIIETRHLMKDLLIEILTVREALYILMVGDIGLRLTLSSPDESREDIIIINFHWVSLSLEEFYYTCIHSHRPYSFCTRTSGPDVKVVRAWTWIRSAHYLGQKVFQQKKVDTWAYNVI